MTLKDLVSLNNKLEIVKIEVKDNDFIVHYKDGKKKKLGHIFVTSVVSGGGETPTGDYATKQWVLNKGYAQQSWVENGYMPKGSLDDYALKSWVVEQGYLTESDLTPYASKEWVSDQNYLVSSDLQGYATEEWVSNKNYLTENDLNGYATEQWVEGKGYITSSALDGYATQSWVEGKGYIDDTYHDSTKADTNHTHTKSEITDFPTNVSAFTNDAGYLTQHQSLDNYYTKSETDAALNGKANLVHTHSEYYEKTGGNISGNADIDGTLTFNIEDEDYDAGIVLKALPLDTNLGTIFQFQGFANGEEQTYYKPIIRNVGTPNSDYDVANKKYVDDHVVVPTYHLVFLNPDGTVDTYASTLNYATVKANLTDPTENDILDIIWGQTRFHAEIVEVTDVNSGDLKFIADIEYAGIERFMVFTLNPQSVLTTTNITTNEIISNKKTSVVNNLSNDYYPTTNAVFNEFQRKPVEVWRAASAADRLKAIQSDISASPSWQLTNLDLTPFKRIKVHSKCGQASGTTASNSTTAAMVLEILLDSDAAISEYGGNYVGSMISQKPNNNNRLATLTCAVSADKTSFVVLRQTNLYGTGATNNNDVNADVFLIEGYYD